MAIWSKGGEETTTCYTTGKCKAKKKKGKRARARVDFCRELGAFGDIPSALFINQTAGNSTVHRTTADWFTNHGYKTKQEQRSDKNLTVVMSSQARPLFWTEYTKTTAASRERCRLTTYCMSYWVEEISLFYQFPPDGALTTLSRKYIANEDNRVKRYARGGRQQRATLLRQP